MAQLENKMEVAAVYNAVPTTAESTVYVEMGNMSLVKTADRETWVNGLLTYTVTLTNIEDPDTGLPLTNIVFTDMIDIRLTRLLTNTVTINGSEAVLGTDYQYNPATGAFTVEYDGELLPDERVVIVFQVTKV